MIINKIKMALVIILLAGCSSYKNVAIHSAWGDNSARYELSAPIEINDTVRYVLRDGSKGEIRYAGKTGTQLLAVDGRKIPLSDIVQLEHKTFSTGKTAAATGAGIGVAAVVVVAVLSVGLAGALIAAG